MMNSQPRQSLGEDQEKQEEVPRVGTYGSADPGVMTKVNNLTKQQLINADCLHENCRIEHGADPGDDATMAKERISGAPTMQAKTQDLQNKIKQLELRAKKAYIDLKTKKSEEAKASKIMEANAKLEANLKDVIGQLKVNRDKLSKMEIIVLSLEGKVTAAKTECKSLKAQF